MPLFPTPTIGMYLGFSCTVSLIIVIVEESIHRKEKTECRTVRYEYFDML